MAQLIKLGDYVSRYENNMLHYSSQFSQLKKQQWTSIKEQWERGTLGLYKEDTAINEEASNGLLKRFKKNWDKLGDSSIDSIKEVVVKPAMNHGVFDFQPVFYYRPHTLEDLKHAYMDKLFPFQLKWASQTLIEKSYIDSKYRREEPLRYFLHQFPDTYLLMYKPVILLKNAPVELDILLITPLHAWCIHVLEEADRTVYIGSTQRFWTVKTGSHEKRIVNPSLSLDRTESIIKGLLKREAIDLPVKKMLLSRNGYIDYPDLPFGLSLLDKKNYESWFNHQQSSNLPLKHIQLKAARTIMAHTQTTSVQRLEREGDEEQPPAF
ncbi:NERD domain-containing protein [Jeotgalibacillus sp. S-D1]|uniref:nuclease-related domain-containing protein n=1 Tax=Jeotgalibacillus sp. S-D1 TaxID=2552189 RepID=UPI00105A760E|nr:nuclease-related domain-containing protein [Jeotgalibacillus sp. S-D1]TDL34247.1 NERD domain-containing protein [Jeotgalibacillus sp. S-D1]